MTPSILLRCVNGDDLNWPAVLTRSQKTVLIFMSIQCPYALACFPVLKRIAEQHVDRHNLQFLLVNSNSDDEEDPENFTEMRARFGTFPIPFCRDDHSSLARLLAATHTPHVFIVSSDGQVRWSGPVDQRFRSPEEWQEGLSGHWPWDDPPPPERPITRLEEVLESQQMPESEPAIGCTIKFEEGGR